MPKSYTEKERTTIITELRRAAMESMVKKGVKKRILGLNLAELLKLK